MNEERDEDIDEGLAQLEQMAQAPTLLRTFTVGQTFRAPRGGRLVVTCVELWTGLIVVHSATVGSLFLAPTRNDMARQMATLQRPLHDDLGNDYRLASMVGGGGGDAVNGVVSRLMSYVGPLDSRATRLVWFSPDLTDSSPIEIELPAQ